MEGKCRGLFAQGRAARRGKKKEVNGGNFGWSSSVSDLGAIESIEVRLINPGLRQVFMAGNSTKCLLMTQVGIVWK